MPPQQSFPRGQPRWAPRGRRELPGALPQGRDLQPSARHTSGSCADASGFTPRRPAATLCSQALSKASGPQRGFAPRSRLHRIPFTSAPNISECRTTLHCPTLHQATRTTNHRQPQNHKTTTPIPNTTPQSQPRKPRPQTPNPTTCAAPHQSSPDQTAPHHTTPQHPRHGARNGTRAGRHAGLHGHVETL